MAIEAEQLSAIGRFAAAAEAYCSAVECEPGEAGAEMRAFATLLATLHLGALGLPEVSVEDEPDAPSTEATVPAQGRFANLPVALYWDVLDPLVLVPEPPVCNSLPDDLAEIYEDLKRGLALLAAERPAAAAWEWRFHFYCHWGEHLVGAQRAIHAWLRRGA